MKTEGCGTKPKRKLARPHFRYCPKCGSELSLEWREGKERPVCHSCGYVHYLNPAPAVAVVAVKDGEILLVRRKFEPRRGMWSLPVGFVEWDEDIREAAIRETKEETGYDVELGPLLGAFSAFDDERTHVVLIVFEGRIVGGKMEAGDDASEVRFFPLDAVPEEMAFRVHKQVIDQVRLSRGGNTAD